MVNDILTIDVIFEIIYKLNNLNDIINFGRINKRYYNIINNNKQFIFNNKIKNKSKFKIQFFNKLTKVLNDNKYCHNFLKLYMNCKYLYDSYIKLNRLKNILKWVSFDDSIRSIQNDYIKKLDITLYKLENYFKDSDLKEIPVSLNELKMCVSSIVDILFFPCEMLFTNNMSLLHGSFKSLFSVLSCCVNLHDFFIVVEYKINCLYNINKTLYNDIVQLHIEYGKYDDFYIRLFNIFYFIDEQNFRDIFIQLYNKLIILRNQNKDIDMSSDTYSNTYSNYPNYSNNQMFLQYDMQYTQSEFEKIFELFLINTLSG